MINNLRKYAMLAVLVLLASGIGRKTAIAADSGFTPDFDKMDTYIKEEMKQCRIPGFALGIVKGDDIIYLKGYGKADTTGRQVTPQTPFLIASLSKSFTATAIMQLVEQQKIELDKPVITYVPWFKLSDPNSSSSITIRQLLNHTSGIGTNAEFEVASLRGDDTTIDQLVKRMSKIKLTGKAGERFQYNNANYIILGEVIQSVTGLSYEEYIMENIFEPLGMEHSFTELENAERDGLAVGYRPVFGFPVPAELPYRKDFLPAYSIISSAEDLSKYVIALSNNGKYKNAQILSEQGIHEMLQPSSKVSKWEDYGFGWYITSGSIYHGGEVINYQSKIKMLPEDELGVILIYNTSSAAITSLFKVGYRDRIESGIISILYGEAPDKVQPGTGILDLNHYPVIVTYTIYLALGILIVILLAISAVRLKFYRKRINSNKRNFVLNLIHTAAVHIALPVYILFAIPGIANAPWGHVLYIMPDIGYFSLVMSMLLLVIGFIKLYYFIQYFNGRHKTL